MIRQGHPRNLTPSLCDGAASGEQAPVIFRIKKGRGGVLPLLELSDGVFGIIAYAVGQYHQSNQLNAGGTGFHLLLSHARQVQLVHVWNDTNRPCQQPEALAAILIHNLQHVFIHSCI